MFGADDEDIVLPSLCLLRNHLGKELKLYDEKEFNFVWITEFPLFEYNKDEKRWQSNHHPFTMPYEEDIPLLDDLEGKTDVVIRSAAYDLALNGVEVGGGSVRIHDSEVQKKIFKALNISDEDIKERFGFFVEALQYGTPPHAGLAIGLDRMVAMMLGYENIREVIAFPKTQKAACLMSDAPGEVDSTQIRDLGLSLRKKEKDKKA
jgi:aspartyl-tRNA synthetase